MIQVGPHLNSHMPPPNLPTSGTKIKSVITWCIALLVMEEGGCSLTFAKLTNPNIMKVATKSPYNSPNLNNYTVD